MNVAIFPKINPKFWSFLLLAEVCESKETERPAGMAKRGEKNFAEVDLSKSKCFIFSLMRKTQ